MSGIKARKVIQRDFENFDYIIGMDQTNHDALNAMASEGTKNKIKLLLDFAPQLDIRDVPDPYYGSLDDFDKVLDLVEEASAGLLDALRVQYL